MMEGRVIGRIEGDQYVWRQGETLLKAIPIEEAAGKKFASALLRNKRWERPDGVVG